MSVIFQKDNRSGITYAYENKSWWDKKKKQSRARRALIGRVDAKTGVIVPTDGRVKKKMAEREKAEKPPPSQQGGRARFRQRRRGACSTARHTCSTSLPKASA